MALDFSTLLCLIICLEEIISLSGEGFAGSVVLFVPNSICYYKGLIYERRLYALTLVICLLYLSDISENKAAPWFYGFYDLCFC